MQGQFGETLVAGRRAYLLVIVTLVAFILRAYRLDTQSLWGDEAISVIRAT